MTEIHRRWLVLLAGPLLAVAVYALLPAEYPAADGSLRALAPGARGAAAVGVWMALWWITDVIPVYVTAMLPLALFPLLGTATAAQAAGAYGDPLIFLFFGGFMLPVATPPNAIAYGTGLVTVGQMARAGFLLNLMGILFITAVTCGIIVPLMGAN